MDTKNFFSMDKMVGRKRGTITFTKLKLRDGITHCLLRHTDRRERRRVNGVTDMLEQTGARLTIGVRVKKRLELG